MANYKAVVISGIMLDNQGYRVSPPVRRLAACVLSNGQLWEDRYGPFERIARDVEGNLDVCGGTFIPDAGEMDRLARNFGAKV